MDGENELTKYNLEIHAQAFNVFNLTNPLAFSGVQSSPFFGQPVSAAALRRAEFGARVTF